MTTVEALTPDHFETVSGWLSDPAINRWLTSEWRDRAVTSVVVAMAVRNKRNQWFLVRHDGQPCGLVALADIDTGDRTAMIWYLLGDRGLFGRGITPAAIRLLTRLAFSGLGLNSLYAWIMEDNTASRRALEKAGYREAGRIRGATCSAGTQLDRVYFDRLSDDDADP